MRAVLRALVVLTLVLGAFTLRAVIGGEAEVAESTAALDRGDVQGAIDHARAAALYYVPAAPHVRVAYARLLAIGEEAERRRDWDLALLAFRSVTTASQSTRWVVAPREEDALVAESAAMRVEQKRAGNQSLPEPPGREPVRASSPLRFCLPGAFVALLAGLVFTLRRGLDESGRLGLRAAAPGIFVTMLGTALYVIALVYA